MNNEMILHNAEQNAQISNRSRFADEGFDLAVDMTTAQTAFCSMVASTPDEKAKLFNAMNNPDHRLAEFTNMTIKAKDLYVEIVECTNQDTGEVTRAPRIVIIDEAGKGYQAVSVGIFSALKKIIQVYGSPTWETPVKMQVKQITKGARKMLTLNVIA